MFQILQTDTFSKWLRRLKDREAKARILARLDDVRLGNLGDWKVIESKIREMRIHCGPGYRIYYLKRGEAVLLLLCGGSKSSQARDIERAKKLLRELED